MKYATRINSFLRFDSNLLNAFRSIGAIEGVDYVDLNYPRKFVEAQEIILEELYPPEGEGTEENTEKESGNEETETVEEAAA